MRKQAEVSGAAPRPYLRLQPALAKVLVASEMHVKGFCVGAAPMPLGNVDVFRLRFRV